MRLLKDPLWQFIGVIVGIIAVAVTLILYFADRPVKKLQVEIFSNNPLISVNTDIAKEIKIFYKDKPVQTLSLILLKFENTGNEPIKENDYSEPIRVSVSQSAEIGEVIVQETRPVGIQLAPTLITNNQVELAKVLLNPGDQAILRILALNNDGTLEVGTRIVGIRDLEIQSALGDSNTSGKNSFGNWVGPIYLGLLVTVIFANLLSDSKRGMAWRKKHWGFDPARHYYILAQEKVLKGPTLDRVNNAIHCLEEAFSWNSSYVEKAKNDTLFSCMQGYERYKVLMEKYESPDIEAGEETRP